MEITSITESQNRCCDAELARKLKVESKVLAKKDVEQRRQCRIQDLASSTNWKIRKPCSRITAVEKRCFANKPWSTLEFEEERVSSSQGELSAFYALRLVSSSAAPSVPTKKGK